MAGGIPQNSDWYYNGSKLCDRRRGNEQLDAEKDDMDVEEPWRMAHTQYEYYSHPANDYIDGKVVTISSAADIPTVLAQCAAESNPIQVGDLMCFTPNGEGGAGTHHASIISTVDLQEIKYAVHTKEKFDELLTDFYPDNEDVCIIRMCDQHG